MKYTIESEKISAKVYIEFLKRTDLGSQYPKERFAERIEKLVKNVSISLVARDEQKVIAVYLVVNDKAIPFYEKLGMKKSDEVMEYCHNEWTDFTVE